VKKRLSILFTILFALTLTAYPSFAETSSSAGSGNNSLEFGSASSYLSLSPGINFSNSAFTFETYFKTGSVIDNGFFLGVGGGNGMSINIHSANEIQVDGFCINATIFVLTNPMQVNTWHHLAVARDAFNNETVWLDGVRASSGYNRWNTGIRYGPVFVDDRNYNGYTTGINISTACAHCNGPGDRDFNGVKMTNFRVVVGSSVYDPNSATITLPSTPLTNVTNTKLLLNVTNSSGYITDSSGTQTVSNSSVVFRSADTTVPNAPTSLSATAGDGQATISFTPGSNGGSAITNYKYSLDGTNFLDFSPSITSSPVTISGLTNGTSYNVYLKAVNARGDSSASTSVSVTPSTTPSAPTSLSATAGDGQATISFTPGSNGGSAITNYKYSLDGTTYTALSPIDSSSPITISGLTNGTSYTVYLKAVNARGDSSASTSVSVTPSTTPSAPTSLTATAGDGQTTISFTAGSDGGSAITNYKYSLDGTNYTALSPTDSSSPVTISGLTNGNTYTIYLKAVNSAGEGSASSSVSVTPVAPTVSDSDSSGPNNYFEPIRKVDVSNGKISWEPNKQVVISQYDPSSKKTTIIESTNGQLVLPKAKPGQSVSYSIMATDGTVLKKVTMKTKPNTPKIAKVASQKSQLLTINNKTAITAQWKKDKSVKKYNIKITLDSGKILAFTTTDPNINLVIDETKGATITITAVGKNNLTSTVTRKI
jgi:hypothetical protein